MMVVSSGLVSPGRDAQRNENELVTHDGALTLDVATGSWPVRTIGEIKSPRQGILSQVLPSGSRFQAGDALFSILSTDRRFLVFDMDPSHGDTIRVGDQVTIGSLPSSPKASVSSVQCHPSNRGWLRVWISVDAAWNPPRMVTLYLGAR